MPPMKRSAAAAASGATAAKMARVPAKKSGHILEVVKGLAASDLPKPARVMLEDMLGDSLDVCKEKRDRYQSKVVDMVGGVLSAVGEALQSKVEASGALVSESTQAKEELESQVAAKGGEVETKHSDVVAKKQEFAEAARSFWRASEAVDEAKAKEQSDALEASGKAKEREALAGILEDFQNHTDGAAPDLVKRLEAMGAPESMVLAFPAMLSKPVSERGSFDVMVSSSVRDWLEQRIAAADEAIQNAEPTRAANADALAKAEAAWREMREQQCYGADTYWKVRAEEEELEKEVQDLRQSVRKLREALRKQQSSSVRSQSTLEAFLKGPKSAFDSLKDKAEEVTPAVDAEKAEGAAQEPAAAMEGVETKDAEVATEQ